MEKQDGMPSSRKKYLFPLSVLALCLVLGGYVFWQQHQGPGTKFPVLAQGAEFSYPDLNGQPVSLSNTNGKVRLLYFFYSYCPDVCPPTTFLLSQVQDELKKEGLFGSKVEFLSVTIDPKRDTPARMKEFGDTFKADYSGWKFLRGDETATAELAKKYQILAEKDPQSGNFSHMNLIGLLDKKGQLRDLISANEYFDRGKDNRPLSDMVKEIKSLL